MFGRTAAVYDTVIPYFSRLGTRLVEVADLRPGERVLDVGCGRGAALYPAAERVAPEGTVVGVDLSEDMVRLLAEELARAGVANASVHRSDAEALDVAPGSFDVVLCAFVLHVLVHPDEAAAGFVRALRPGGRCAASVPMGGGPEWEFLGRLMGAYVPRTVRPLALPFRREFDLPAVLRGAGLEVVGEVDEEVPFLFRDEQAWWEWSWTHGMRALLEALSEEDLAALKEDAMAELGALRTPEGIPMLQRVKFVVAERPGAG